MQRGAAVVAEWAQVRRLTAHLKGIDGRVTLLTSMVKIKQNYLQVSVSSPTGKLHACLRYDVQFINGIRL